MFKYKKNIEFIFDININIEKPIYKNNNNLSFDVEYIKFVSELLNDKNLIKYSTNQFDNYILSIKDEWNENLGKYKNIYKNYEYFYIDTIYNIKKNYS